MRFHHVPLPSLRSLRVLMLAAFLAALCRAQTNQELPAGLFGLREMDFHLHSGMERPVALEDWIDLAVADGRKVFLLLDHIELYRKTPPEYEAWRTKGGFQARYPLGAAGHKALFADFDSLSRRKDILIFKGWEIGERELDEGLETAPMQLAEVIGWHIGPNHGGEPPNGQTISTDNHHLRAAGKSFAPERYCDSVGITPANTNALVRELLALRARRALNEAAAQRAPIKK